MLFGGCVWWRVCGVAGWVLFCCLWLVLCFGLVASAGCSLLITCAFARCRSCLANIVWLGCFACYVVYGYVVFGFLSIGLGLC